MGLTFVSLSFKGATQDEMVSAISSHLPDHSCWVSPQTNGWVTVLDYVCDNGGESEYVETASILARSCHRPGIVFRMLFSDFLFYWLVNEQGEFVDRSYVEDIDHATLKEMQGLAGSPKRLAAYAKPGVRGADIRKVLWKRKISRYDNFCLLADLLGIDQAIATLSFTEIERNSSQWHQQHVRSWESFVRIQATSSTKPMDRTQIESRDFATSITMANPATALIAQPLEMNWLAGPPCRLKMEKCTGGMKLTCACDDQQAIDWVQNQSHLLEDLGYNCCCLMNGMMVYSCNFTMGVCKYDKTDNGACVTCTSGDPNCCEMIQANCDCLACLIQSGCTCYVMVNNTPTC